MVAVDAVGAGGAVLARRAGALVDVVLAQVAGVAVDAVTLEARQLVLAARAVLTRIARALVRVSLAVRALITCAQQTRACAPTPRVNMILRCLTSGRCKIVFFFSFKRLQIMTDRNKYFTVKTGQNRGIRKYA